MQVQQTITIHAKAPHKPALAKPAMAAACAVRQNHARSAWHYSGRIRHLAVR